MKYEALIWALIMNGNISINIESNPHLNLLMSLEAMKGVLIYSLIALTDYMREPGV